MYLFNCISNYDNILQYLWQFFPLRCNLFLLFLDLYISTINKLIVRFLADSVHMIGEFHLVTRRHHTSIHIYLPLLMSGVSFGYQKTSHIYLPLLMSGVSFGYQKTSHIYPHLSPTANVGSFIWLPEDITHLSTSISHC